MQITKIFRFEMAHAIHGYDGPCKHIHGHSYILHVTVSGYHTQQNYLPAPGFIMDFKALKKIVQQHIIQQFDHALLLSGEFIANNPASNSHNNLMLFPAEPTAENLLIFIRNTLQEHLPKEVHLKSLLLYETNDAYAAWYND